MKDVLMSKINVTQLIDDGVFNKHHGWIMFWCFFIMFAEGYDIVVIGTVIPVIMKEWELSPVIAGTLASYLIIGMALGTFIISPLSDKYGRLKITIAGMFLFSICMLGAALSEGPTSFGICRFLSGLGIGGVMPNLISWVSDYSPKYRRNRMIAVQQSSYSVGGMLAAGAAMFIISDYGWRPVLMIGVFPIICLPFLYKMLPESPTYYFKRGQFDKLSAVLQKMNPNYNPSASDEFELAVAKSTKMPVAKLFQEHRAFSTIMIWLVLFCSMFMVYGMSTWLPKLMQGAGYDMGSSIMTLMSLSLGGIIGAYVGGLLSDKWNPKYALMTLYGTAALAVALMSFQMDIVLLNIVVMVSGMGTLGAQYTFNAYVSQFYSPDMKSTAVGWSLGVGRIGGTFSPAILGWFLALQMPFYSNFLFISVIGLVAVMAIRLIQEKYSFRRSMSAGN
jgi:AAHS family benzoate transporter-like MFS transporter